LWPALFRQVLAASNIKCEGLSTVQIEDKILTEERESSIPPVRTSDLRCKAVF
jgi:hypothetical protein